MSLTAANFEQLGTFYLGRKYDDAAHAPVDEPVLYDSKDLVTHGVVLGMTGSGKTGLCLALIEEAAIDGVPAIIIDPKGDLTNLLLTFPDLKAEDFRPWIDEDAAGREGLSADDFAQKTAEKWKNGLAEWGQDGERIARLRNTVDFTIYTPGSRAGVPVSILESLSAPAPAVADDDELIAERAESMASSLLGLVGVDADPLNSPEAILLAAIFVDAWRKGESLTLESLIPRIEKPGLTKIGVYDLDSVVAPKARKALALKLNNLLASPGFSVWLEGPALDVGRLLRSSAGKPQIAIFTMAHLDDAERQFFTSLLLNQSLAWTRSQPGTSSLRALIYMDEIFGYLPPTANPPTKKPLLTLLKQARASGVGLLLATQNPVDLDYKALSNIGTWFLGRLQTERDQQRLLDGLDSSSSGAKWDRNEIQQLLSGMEKRVFLLHNVHDDGPQLFQVRWAMSYLAGPIGRDGIQKLMADRREELGNGKESATAASANPMSMGLSEEPAAALKARPVVGQGVIERFARVTTEEGVYQPYLMRTATVSFDVTKAKARGSRKVRSALPMAEKGIDWKAVLPPPPPDDTLSDVPEAGVGFAELPAYAMQADNYKTVSKEFAEILYREQTLELFYCEELDAWSQYGESEADFRGRLDQAAREARDEEVEKLREATAKKVAALQSKRTTAEGQLAKQKAESQSAILQTGLSVLGGALGALLGSKKKLGLGSLRSGASALGKASSAYKQHQDVDVAEDKIESLDAEMQALQEELQKQIDQLRVKFDPTAIALTTESFKPKKTDISVETVGLLWKA